MISEEQLDDAKKSLARMQEFNAESLSRKTELGQAFEMSEAVAPAKRLVSLFQKLPVDTLDLFPQKELEIVDSTSSSVYKIFSEVLGFDPGAEAEPKAKRKQLVDQIESQYQTVFTRLYPLISFSVARTADFISLGDEGRAVVQSIEDRVQGLVEEITSKAGEVESALNEARKNLAEQGVSQEAFHFQKEAELHNELADQWQTRTFAWALVLGGFALASLFLHRWGWLAPKDNFETAQFIVSKILVFGVIAFMLALSSKNYLSHRHNEIVSRHRQNALLTYRSLVEASGAPEVRDIVLQRAAEAIYGLQDTGLVRPSEAKSNTITELLPRASLPLSTGSNT